MANDKIDNDKKEKLKQLQQQKKQMSKEIDELKGNGTGSKVKGVLLFLLILLLFLGGMSAMIKADVGGFGSGVLAPIIGNINGLNKILPAGSVTNVSDTADSEDTNKQDTIDTANNTTKTQQTADASSTTETASAEAATDTQATSDSQAASNGTGISSTDTQNTTEQSTESEVSDEDIADYADTYSKMDAESAAGILQNMTGDLRLVAKILESMTSSKRAKIMGKMDVNIASKITKIMSEDINISN